MDCQKFRSVFLGVLLMAVCGVVTGCSDRDFEAVEEQAKPSAGTNAGVAVDPYIVGALFEEVLADGQTILQASSTRSDDLGHFYFPDTISVGSIIRMQPAARGLHGGVPYTGMLSRQVFAEQQEPFVISPITTFLVNNISPGDLLELLENSGLPGLQKEDLFRDPMQVFSDTTKELTRYAWTLIQANLAVGVYLEFLDIAGFIDSGSIYESHYPHFTDAVRLVQDTLDEQLFMLCVDEIGSSFLPEDRLATSVRLNQLILLLLEQAVADGQTVSSNMLSDMVAEVVVDAVTVAREVYADRTGDDTDRFPTGVDDTVSAVEGGSAVTGNLLANDAAGDAPVVVTAVDQAGSSVPLGAVFTTHGGGTLTVAADGSYSYTPPTLGNVPPGGLSEVFGYVIADRGGDAGSARLTIQVADTNRLPAAMDDTASAVEGGSAVTGNLLANDAAGDAPVVVTAVDQAGSSVPLGAVFTTHGGGTLTVAADGSYSYTPSNGGVPPAGLTESFRYAIEDVDGDSSSAMLAVNTSYNGQAYSISLSSPVRIALAPTRQILVSSFISGTIQIFNPDSLQLEGRIEGNRKMSAVGATSDRVFVGLEAPRAVGVYAYDGQLLYLLGSGVGEFDSPSDLVIDESSGRVYVTDSRMQQVRVYSLADGAFLRSFGQDRMHFPTGIAIDQTNGTLLVSDFGVGTEGGGSMSFDPASYYAGIWRYDLNGNYQETITGNFSRPQGLAVNATGDIFLADSLLGEVLVFRRNPDAPGYLQPYSYWTGDMPLRLPLDVAVDPVTHTLYVTNNLFNRVEAIPGGGLLP